MTLATAKQGMQPWFDGVKVGVVKIGLSEGAPAIQVWIRTTGHARKQAFREGQWVVLPLPGAGILRIKSSTPPP
ncbi:hypothetical protein ACIQTZ_13350 [Paenarthrobacter sp. NPDC090520]|uniref:hypothetical protein n=1 Tax=Paenarthrobacter sp. NPDC090520 TaxID=3364382 RepID=UPI00381F9CBF